ncbi:MAG: CPBP family intramembrane glutamic endopeptidase [Saprospiraceae bacterium]|nr:CPBP family intramembrane metalloprotease [Lewinella sp.]
MIEPIDLNLVDHLLFLLLGIILPFRTIGAQKKLKDMHFNQRMRISLYIGNSIGLWLMALAILGAWWWFGRSYSTLGLIWTKEAGHWLSVGVISLFFIVYCLDAVRDVLTEKGRAEAETRLSEELNILPRTFKSYSIFVLLAISAGICEEIVFRGFFMSYLISLLGTATWAKILAVSIPAVIFGYVHTYQGKQAIFKIVGMALLFGTIFMLTGSLYLLILLHAVVDLVGGAIGLFFPEPENELYTPEASRLWEEE